MGSLILLNIRCFLGLERQLLSNCLILGSALVYSENTVDKVVCIF